MAASTATLVAESLINLSHGKSDPVSNLKLQKLLYYSQAWHLVLTNEPLFDEEIEAWVHGPVVPSVFRKYREYRWTPLPRTQSEILTKNHLEEVWKAYGKFDASKLERLTHSEPPWKNARADLPLDMPCHCVITKSAMKVYYSSLLNER